MDAKADVRELLIEQRVRSRMKRVLDAIHAPAYVRNGRLDILAANPLGAALLDDPSTAEAP